MTYNPVGIGTPGALDAILLRRRGPSGSPWPRTSTERSAEADRRWAAYLNETYTQDDIRRMSLFEARDESDRVIIAARRVCADIAYVAEVDAASIASDGVTLQADPEADLDDAAEARLVDQASEVWRRSDVQRHLPRWALSLCVGGEALLESVRHADGTRICLHEAGTYTVELDPTDGQVSTAIIRYYLPRPAVVGADGEVASGGEPIRYVRVITRQEVRVYRDGALDPAESGPNSLGIVPCYEVTYRSVRPGHMSAWAGTHYEDLLATFDSLVSQLQALGTRHANPILVGTGVDVGDSAALQVAGKAVAIPSGSELAYLEAQLQGIMALVQLAMDLQTQARATQPEFLFVESGAGSSGTALSYRATAYVTKIRPIREGMYRGLAWITSVALAMDAGAQWAPAMDLLQVDGGDPLPMDEAARASLAEKLVAAGLMTRQTAVRHLQSVGLIEAGDPARYADAALAEMQAVAGTEAEALLKLNAAIAGIRGYLDGATEEIAVPVEEPDDDRMSDDTDAPDNLSEDPAASESDVSAAPADPAADALADTALNGAQVEAAVGIIQQVAAGALPRDSGVTMLIEFFQLDPARAEKIMGSVGRGFTPAAPDSVSSGPPDSGQNVAPPPADD